MAKFTLIFLGALLLVSVAESRPQGELGDGEVKRRIEDPREPEDIDIVRTIERATTAEPNRTTTSEPNRNTTSEKNTTAISEPNINNLEATTGTSANTGAIDNQQIITTPVVSQATTNPPAGEQTTNPPASEQTTNPSAGEQTTAPVGSQVTTASLSGQDTNSVRASASVNALNAPVEAANSTQVPLFA